MRKQRVKAFTSVGPERKRELLAKARADLARIKAELHEQDEVLFYIACLMMQNIMDKALTGKERVLKAFLN